MQLIAKNLEKNFFNAFFTGFTPIAKLSKRCYTGFDTEVMICFLISKKKSALPR